MKRGQTPFSVKRTTNLLRDAVGLSDGVMFERRLFHSLFDTNDQKAGMDAFVNKRQPTFTHS